MPRLTIRVVLIATLLIPPLHCLAADTATLVQSIKAVGREGRGNREANQAVAELSQQDVSALPTVLRGFRDANPLAANYLRAAAESIADWTLKAGKPLPNETLEKLIRDAEQDPRARRLAYELLVRVDAAASDRIIPEMLLDPSPEFRRDAVARLIAAGEKLLKDKEEDNAKAAFKKALSGATDDDQVKVIAKQLKGLKEEIDLQKHFGFLTSWRVVGPFDNEGLKGFDISYPPEEKLDLTAKYAGQKGEVAWDKVATDHEYGIVNIAKQIAPHKWAAMYLTTEYHSPAERVVEFRLGTPNAWKIWLNGKLLFGRDEYHRGMAIDQYRVRGELKPGANTILLKLCQNEQKEDWAQRYEFQLRVADLSGLGLPSQPAQTTSQK
jgi:hypothetical protein